MSQAKYDAVKAAAVESAMAECMELFRNDMIRAGVIDDLVSPMFMTEAILGAIQRAVLAEREACMAIIANNNPRNNGTATVLYSFQDDEAFDNGWLVAIETKLFAIRARSATPG